MVQMLFLLSLFFFFFLIQLSYKGSFSKKGSYCVNCKKASTLNSWFYSPDAGLMWSTPRLAPLDIRTLSLSTLFMQALYPTYSIAGLLVLCCRVQTSSEYCGTAPALGGVSLSHSHFLDGDIMAPNAWETDFFHICSPNRATFILYVQIDEASVQSEISGKWVLFNNWGGGV